MAVRGNEHKRVVRCIKPLVFNAKHGQVDADRIKISPGDGATRPALGSQGGEYESGLSNKPCKLDSDERNDFVFF